MSKDLQCIVPHIKEVGSSNLIVDKIMFLTLIIHEINYVD